MKIGDYQKNGTQKMQELRETTSSTILMSTWHGVSAKMHQNQKEKTVLFWFVNGRTIGFVLPTYHFDYIQTRLIPIPAQMGINDNGQIEYSMPYHKTLTEIKESQVWQKTKCNSRPIRWHEERK